uniref:Bestrophin homolog n=1 Tax=Parascaris equorum TaxID=6256 RepID=A0A914RYT9_PAREQ
MTVSYHLDLSSSTPFTFLRVLFRWRGSVWKSVATELFIWTIFYYKIDLFYRSDWILTPEGKRQALFVSTYIRGDDPETRIQRRNIVRYICLSQVLVFRDISMRVRRRFPTMQSVMKAGFLLPHELEMLEGIDLKYNKYFVPFNWIFSMIYKLRKEGKIDADVLMNSMLQEIRLFRTNLAELCNYDWVPVPLAYPQV